MTMIRRAWVWLALVAACSFPRPPDVKNRAVRIGGNVHGLWTGADAVTLRLSADGVDSVHSATANGTFSFPGLLAEGDSYAVEVVSGPAKHTCTVSEGASGIVPANDLMSLDIACRGPATSISLSAPDVWIFDPTNDLQPVLDASLLLQAITLTIDNPDGLLTSAQVAGEAITFGEPSSPRELPLGTATIDVDVVAQGGLSKTYQIVIKRGERIISQVIYGKPSNAAGSFGVRIAVSGNTLVVGGPNESSSATGVNGNQMDTNAPLSGAVYIFQWTGSAWIQQAYIKASNTQSGDTFGASVAISGDLLAVGAPREDSNAISVNGDQADNSMTDSGSVYVFQRSGTTWAQQAYIKPFDSEVQAEFGTSVALSEGTLAVGAPGEASAAVGINGDPSGSGATQSGAVYVFVRAGPSWFQQAYMKASNSRSGSKFGDSIALSGNTLAVGGPFESSGATGIDGNQTDQSASNAGAVYVFQRANGSWSQQAYVKASNTRAFHFFGSYVTIEGDMLAVGAIGDDSNATGVDGDQNNTNAPSSGAVYVFERTGSMWKQEAYIKASNAGASDFFGESVSLSGTLLAVGATREASVAEGVNGDQQNNDADSAGAAYLFRKNDSRWTQEAYVKASNTDAGDLFGSSVALSQNSLLVGAVRERSSATGINGNQEDNSVLGAGAVYLFY